MNSSRELRVKVLRNTGTLELQLPESGRFGGVQFDFDADSRDYDWLVVYSGFNRPDARFGPAAEPLACSPENTLLITHEPSSVRRYARLFVNQFRWVISCHEPEFLDHPRLIPGHPASPWVYRKPYGELVDDPFPRKDLLFSTFCSTKDMDHTLHKDRVAFTAKLGQAVPEMALFGFDRGGPAVSKPEGLDSYRYHLAIENHIGRNHWTEKLADAFLGRCFPFYCGCPNIFDFFPEKSLISLDIFNFGESLERIRKAIADREWDKNRSAIEEARRRVIEEHNLFAVIARFVKERHDQGDAPAGGRRIWNHSGIVRLNPVAGLVHAVKKATQQHHHRRAYRQRRKNSDLY